MNLHIKIEHVGARGAKCLLDEEIGTHLITLTVNGSQLEELQKFLQDAWCVLREKFVVYDNQILFNLCEEHTLVLKEQLGFPSSLNSSFDDDTSLKALKNAIAVSTFYRQPISGN